MSDSRDYMNLRIKHAGLQDEHVELLKENIKLQEQLYALINQYNSALDRLATIVKLTEQ